MWRYIYGGSGSNTYGGSSSSGYAVAMIHMLNLVEELEIPMVLLMIHTLLHHQVDTLQIPHIALLEAPLMAVAHPHLEFNSNCSL